MEFPTISAVTAGVLLMLQQLLMLNVGMYRTKVRMGTGYGNDQNLERLGRRHGNLAENAAIFIVTLALLELQLGPTTVVVSLAIAFIVARLAHAIGFSSLAGSHLGEGSKLFLFLRAGGATFTALIGLATAAYLLINIYAAGKFW